MDEKAFEQRLQEVAVTFRFPNTPDVARRLRYRPRSRAVPSVGRLRPAWIALVVAMLLLALLAVPQVRAAVLEFLQIGAIRILPIEAPATPLPADDPDATLEAAVPPRTLLDLAGATTLEAAQASAPFPLRSPAYPADLGAPDEVFQQQLTEPGLNTPVYIFVWYKDDVPGEVRLALYQIGFRNFALKTAAASAIAETFVRGERAYWVRGPHEIRLASGESEEWLFVPGSVLVWTEDGITYRLEGASEMPEAVRIARSLTAP